MATTLASIPGGLLPPTITEPIFKRANEVSAVMQLARKVPLSLTAQTNIPVPMDVPAAGWVAEGGAKPVGNATIGVKQMQGKKVALLLPVSEEVARTNAAGLFEQLREDAPTAIARAFDHACIHGKDLRTGGAGPFGEYLLQTGQSVEIGTASQANGGPYADLVQGEVLVTNAGYEFNGFAADPRLVPKLKLSTDTTGRPIWVDSVTQGTQGGQLIGYPAHYNRGVSGSYLRQGNRVQTVTVTGTPTGGTFTLSFGGATTAPIAYNAAAGAVQTALRALGGALAGATVAGSAGGPYTVTIGVAGVASGPITAASALTGGTSPKVTAASSPTLDTGLRAVGGDWGQCAWGQGMDLTVKVSDVASYVDEAGVTHSAFQENLVLLLIEAHFGFVMGDPNAFVAYTDLA
ncbi:MAG: phage major capsid protein [Micropruina sp.]